MSDIRIFFCMMGLNRLEELKQLKPIHTLFPHVDQIIYIDGSDGRDGTEKWLFDEFRGLPIIVVRSKWVDDFPGQRTQYLNLVGEIRLPNEESWVVVNDTDESFSPLLAKNLRAIIDKARFTNDMILVRCKSVTVNGKLEVVHETFDDFYKPLIFRYYPKTRYWGDRSSVTKNVTALHEALQVNGKFVWHPIKLNDQDGKLYYQHTKLEHIIWERGCRNFIVFGGGPNLGEKQSLWKPFREMLDTVFNRSDYTSYEVLEYFRGGNIDQLLKDWMIKYRKEEGYDGSSEVRECFLTYFILYNPSEIPPELVSEYKQYLNP